jgi:hypothetical protein
LIDAQRNDDGRDVVISGTVAGDLELSESRGDYVEITGVIDGNVVVPQDAVLLRLSVQDGGSIAGNVVVDGGGLIELDVVVSSGGTIAGGIEVLEGGAIAASEPPPEGLEEGGVLVLTSWSFADGRPLDAGEPRNAHEWLRDHARSGAGGGVWVQSGGSIGGGVGVRGPTSVLGGVLVDAGGYIAGDVSVYNGWVTGGVVAGGTIGGVQVAAGTIAGAVRVTQGGLIRGDVWVEAAGTVNGEVVVAGGSVGGKIALFEGGSIVGGVRVVAHGRVNGDVVAFGRLADEPEYPGAGGSFGGEIEVIDGGRIGGDVRVGKGVSIGGDVTIGNGGCIDGMISVAHSGTIDGDLVLQSGGVVRRGVAIADGGTVRGDVFLLGGSTAEGYLRLRGAIEGRVTIHGVCGGIELTGRFDRRVDLAPSGEHPTVLVGVRGGEFADRVAVGDRVDVSRCDFSGCTDLDKFVLSGRDLFGSRSELSNPPVAILFDPDGTVNLGEGNLLSDSTIASINRQLRANLEGSRNRPAAAVFYRTEMNARRRIARERGSLDPEHLLLWLYYTFAGYGLSVVRPAAALVGLWLASTGLFRLGRLDLGLNPEHASLPESLLFTAKSLVSFWQPPAAPLLSLPDQYLQFALRIIGPVLVVVLGLAIRERVRR